jgi:AcrR family transcriptional regulator
MAADRRRLIVQSARRLFTSRPYDQVTTSEIAKDAGVAYGLIAHHFENKRGLYLAVTNEIADEIAAIHRTPPPAGTSLIEALRHALRHHIAYIDSHSGSFVALIRGALGADPEHQAAVDRLRWLGAQRILSALGIAEPAPAVLRTSMHGWVGYLDEMMIDRIAHRDVEANALVELATAALLTTLRSVAALDASIAFPAELRDAWQHSGEPWPSAR